MIAEELGARLLGRLKDDDIRVRDGIRPPTPARDWVRCFREYRHTLERLRLEQLMARKLKLLDEPEPLTEDEYQRELAEMKRELLEAADADDLERALRARPVLAEVVDRMEKDEEP